MIIDLEHELTQYVATTLWASIDEQPDGNGGPPMDANYGPEDIAPDSLASMRAELSDFLQGPACHPDATAEEIAAHERALDFWAAELGAGQIGHDFWLTRNGHGAGFWDRFTTGVGYMFGRYLTECSRPYGESYLYTGDDGRVYVA